MNVLILASILAVGYCEILLGGKTDLNIKDPEIEEKYLKMAFAEFGFSRAEANEDVQLVKVQAQVVSGINTFITLKVGNKICELDIYDQSWTNTHQVTKNTCTITKRQLGMPGGWSDVQDRTTPEVQKVVGFVLDRLNMQVNSMFRFVELNIKSLKQQVVAGMKYNITMSTGASTCRNDQVHQHLTAVRCPLDATNTMKPVTVNAVVWTKSWENFMQILYFHITDHEVDIDVTQASKDELLGGDQHDYIVHGKVSDVKVDTQKPPKKALLGGDTHDYQTHGYQNMMGHHMMGYNQMGPGMMGDYSKMGPDMMRDEKMGPGMMGDYKNMGPGMMGDYKNMGPGMMGDYKNMGPDMMGDYKNDMMPNDKTLIGGGDHDYQTHGEQQQLGGDTHDYQPHGQPLIGGGTHDYEPHGKPLIGGDTHDYIPHDDTSEQKSNTDCSQEMFLDFQKKYNKKYSAGKETTKRYMTFCKNMRKARKIQETEKGSARYGVTKFADLTEEEFKQYLGKPWHEVKNYNTGMKRADIPKGPIPESFDWRERGAVTGVKNQGSCGSCWAFSTTGNIEGQWAIKQKQLVSLSEQELVDCDKLDEGCNGGLPSNAYKEIERLGGLETEKEYSYKGEDEKCHFIKKDVKVFINSSVTISSNETEMAAWLAANGPISIGINAMAMQFYLGGISHPWKIFCNPKNLDHGVLIVGYSVKGSEPYWIIKNSWGPDWGEKGYYLVYRGGGVCGLNTMCTSSVVD